MKFKNKKTNKIVEVNEYTQFFAYTHNSDWEKVTEKPKKKENTEKDI